MIKDVNVSQTRSRSVLSRPLKRGTACMNCRFLKIVCGPVPFLQQKLTYPLQKCDGIRPTCGPCRKQPKEDQCEYTDGPTRSRTKALEDTVQRLEARLLELERPEANTPSVTLHDPYSTYPQPQNQPSLPLGHRSLPVTPFEGLPRILTPASPISHLDSFSPPPSTTASTPPFGLPGNALSPLGIFDARVVVTPESSVSSGLDFQDVQLWDTLIQNFLPHGPQFGFFLDPQRLISRSASPTSATSFLQRTSPALLHTLCAFGAHLSAPRDRVTEDRFVFRALQATASTTDFATPQILLHTIQAEVLLAYYLWRTGSLLRARVHVNNAASLVIGAGLHRNRSTVLTISESHNSIEHHHISSANDTLDVGERTRAVWAVITLQKLFAISLDGEEAPQETCGLFEHVAVELPWPREVEEYRDIHGLFPNTAGDQTMKKYLGGHDRDGGNDSLNTMLVKATLLLHRTVYMHGQWAAASTPPAQQGVINAFHTVADLATILRSQLPSRYPPNPRRSPSNSSHSSGSSNYSHSPPYGVIPVDERVRLAHAFLDGTTMRLHQLEVVMSGYGYDVANARSACVHSAVEMLKDSQGMSVVSPIMGTLWRWAIGCLSEELQNIRQQQQQPNWSYDYNYENELQTCLQEGFNALRASARDSVYMRRELELAGIRNEMATGIGV
ncbi:Zn(2)-C6 fungal-type domain-containing protein [Mycena indigotica]|uniref:Zn(2)-C6 fungal-type domain-containing protein n=1 Tax=Mycena indigotica TaxID=2126181 RepID=A0A8H6S7N7_9AGAR|nr:Zn(2)-C6 fungal-type domain-containing protein [Mycena indigotica]KAF7294545.1 Zn(2)-C6 fungal-type domain-containing protein [Mycena indigotica]